MARYRKIDTRTWNDRKFNELSDNGKLVLFLLLTHPHLTPIGAMRGTVEGLASEIRWPIEKFKKAFEECSQTDMIKYDQFSAFIWLPNFLKYNAPASPNVVKSWDEYLDYLPECEFKNQLIDHVKRFIETMTSSFQEALPEAFGKIIANQEQEQEKKQDQKQKQEEKLLSGEPDAVASLKDNFKNQILDQNFNQDSSLKSQATEILEFLNEKTGKNFRCDEINLKLVIDVLKSGISSKQCFQVIASKTREWRKDPKTFDWLRPKTLFNRVNIEQYIGELGAERPEEKIA